MRACVCARANEKLLFFSVNSSIFAIVSIFFFCVCMRTRACVRRFKVSEKMLESKKPSQLIKKLQANEVELKVHLLDDSSHVFNVKVSVQVSRMQTKFGWQHTTCNA